MGQTLIQAEGRRGKRRLQRWRADRGTNPDRRVKRRGRGERGLQLWRERFGGENLRYKGREGRGKGELER